MAGFAGSNVETCPCGDQNGTPSISHSHGGKIVDGILGSTRPKQKGPETLTQVEDHLFIEEATPTSPTSTESANVKPTNSQITSKYKTKEEKKKARLARRKANRAMFGYNRGNNRKAQNIPVPTEGNSIENKSQGTVEVSKEHPSSKHSNKGTTINEHRSSINKCRHLAVAVRREDRAPVDEALAKLIRKRLTDLIGEEVERIMANNTNISGKVIQFHKSGLVSAGFFLVTPATAEARDWLLSRDLGLLGGTRVVAKKLERKKRKVRPGSEKTLPSV